MIEFHGEFGHYGDHCNLVFILTSRNFPNTRFYTTENKELANKLLGGYIQVSYFFSYNQNV